MRLRTGLFALSAATALPILAFAILAAAFVVQGENEAFVAAAKARQALENIAAVLREAGARPEHVVRMTWYVVDKREYLAAARAVGAAYREIIGAYNAAITAVEVKALIEDRARVEIECTAVVPE
jgi:enamine deaminase RidA (YjgF/YER057c/UK114 family)